MATSLLQLAPKLYERETDLMCVIAEHTLWEI